LSSVRKYKCRQSKSTEQRLREAVGEYRSGVAVMNALIDEQKLEFGQTNTELNQTKVELADMKSRIANLEATLKKMMASNSVKPENSKVGGE